MAVHIIIDGYNLIRQSTRLQDLDAQDIQLGRDALIERLAAYKRIKAHKITVVFDGANAPAGLGRRDQVKGIRVRYSAAGQTADDIIKQMAARERERALVVSSDHEVAGYAALAGAATIDAAEFDERVAFAVYLGFKGEGAEAEGAEGWKPTTRKKGPSRRRSKKERRKYEKIKKL